MASDSKPQYKKPDPRAVAKAAASLMGGGKAGMNSAPSKAAAPAKQPAQSHAEKPSAPSGKKTDSTGATAATPNPSDLEKQLVSDFKSYSVAEFFKKNRQMLGYSGKVRSLTTIVHEYVTNSLDSCEDAKILPEIKVEISEMENGHIKVMVEDNGTGIPRSKVGDALGKLLAGTKFHQHKQKRGQQGIGACMRGDTLVPLADGRILPIKEIVERDLVGEKVLALDLGSLKIVPAPIIKCVLVKNPQFIELKAAKGKTIYLTPENPVLTVRNGGLEWVRADEISEGEKIAAPSTLPTQAGEAPLTLDLLCEDVEVDAPAFLFDLRVSLKKRIGGFDKLSQRTGINKAVLRNWFTRKMPSGNPRGRPKMSQLVLLGELVGLERESIKAHANKVGHFGTFVSIPHRINEDICWLAGIIAGDGHMTKEEDDKWGTGIGLANKDKRLIDLFCEKMQEVFGLNYGVNYNSKKGYYFAQTSSALVGRLLEKLGLKRGRKFDTFELSSSLLALPDKMLAAYLRGIFDAEGSVSLRNRSVSFLIHNPHAIEQISLLLLRFGIYSSVSKNLDQKRIQISGKQNLEAFADKIGFSSTGKMQNLYLSIDSIKAPYTPSEVVPNISPLLRRFKGFSKNSAVHDAIIKGSASKYSLRLMISQAKEGQVELPVEIEKHANSDLLWLDVKSTKRVANPEMNVYDLEVGEHHNFVANGIIAHNSYATLFSQITTGKPTHVKSGLGDYKTYECEVSVDVKENKPIIAEFKEYSKNFRGLRIAAEFAEVTYNRSEYSVYEYMRRTALANPHTQLTLVEPSKEIVVFPRASTKLPPTPKNTLPHPLGITTSDLMDMASSSQARKIGSFLSSEFSRVSGDKVKELQALCKDVDFNRSPQNLQWAEAEQVVKAISQVKWIAPEMDTMVPITDEQIQKSLKNLLEPEVMKVVERKPKVFRGGVPFLVEAGIAYGGKSGTEMTATKESEKSEKNVPSGSRGGEMLRFANRVPLLFDAGTCAITEAVKTVDWARYDLRNWESLPVSIFVNFVSVYVPYTGAGKLAISQEEEIVAEIRYALMECAREISIYLHSLQKAEDQERRRQLFFRYIGEVAESLEDITGKAQAPIAAKLKKLAEERTALAEKLDESGEGELEEMERAAEKELESEREED